MAIAYRIGAIFALFQASVSQTWRASHARRGRRVSRAPRPLHACLKNVKKMAAVLHGGCHSDICNDPHSLECE